MSVTPQQLLESAKLIRAHLEDEAGYRAVISRAYYAAYHAAQEFHNSLPSPGVLATSKGGVHEQLAERLTKPTIKTTDPLHLKSRRIGLILRDLCRTRVIADYQLREPVVEAAADSATLISEKLLALV